jgi:hypothetical protein
VQKMMSESLGLRRRRYFSLMKGGDGDARRSTMESLGGRSDMGSFRQAWLCSACARFASTSYHSCKDNKIKGGCYVFKKIL